MLRLEMRCGHVIEVDPRRGISPVCHHDGERRVARTIAPPLPRIVGHGSGPLVQAKRLKAKPVNLAPRGALKLKSKTKDDDR